jgi:hypothetical protein
MTVSATNAFSGPLLGNGATTAFPFTFAAQSAAEVSVYADGAILGSGFTVALNSGNEGGTVTFDTAPASGVKILIASSPDFTQDVSFTDSGPYLAEAHDDANDRAAVRDIYLKGLVSRAPIGPIGETPGPLPARADLAGKFLGGDADGNLAALSGTGADSALRTDMVSDSGFTLIKYKNSDANAYARSGAQLKAMGADDSDGLSLVHFIDPSLDDGLLDGINATALDSAFTNALANLATVQSSTGRKTRLLIPAFEYLTSAAVPFSVDDLVVDGFGATISNPLATNVAAFGLNGDNMKIRGLGFHLTATAGDPSPYINVTGANITLDGVKIDRDALAHIPMYLRAGADGFCMFDCEANWYGGINSYGVSNVAIMRSRFTNINPSSADDGIAIKASPSFGSSTARNWKIAYCHFDGTDNFVGIGSEIGAAAANDPTYASIVEGVHIIGCTGNNCAKMLYIKPGGNDAVDYRDGTVRGVTLDDCTLTDPSGTRLATGIWISPGRGARVFDVTGKNNKIIGRCHTGSSNLYGMWIYLRNDGTGTADVAVDEIDVGIEVIDPYQGVASGGTAPGSPFTSFVNIEKVDSAHGTASNITLDVVGKGCLQSAINIAAGFDDAVTVRKAHLTNVNTNGSTAYGGVATKSRITVGTDIQMTSFSGYPYVFPTAGSGDVICPAFTEQDYIGTQGATATSNLAINTAKNRCQLIALDMLTTNAVAQNATNYTSWGIANLDLSGTNFANWGTLTTGAAGNQKRSAVTANALTPLMAFRDFTLDANRAQCLLPRDGRIQLTKINGGTGAALNDVRVRLRAAPY